MNINREQRIRRAEELFMQGFNCSQSVVAAFADIYGYTEEQALRMSAGFGAGIGRLRMSCGAFNALALLAGLDCGSVTPGDREGKSYNYKVVQQLADRFRQAHGSLICGEIETGEREPHLCGDFRDQRQRKSPFILYSLASHCRILQDTPLRESNYICCPYIC